jgi:hypothetical protein
MIRHSAEACAIVVIFQVASTTCRALFSTGPVTRGAAHKQVNVLKTESRD